MTLALVLLAAGLAERLDLLLVITNMTLGFAVVNAPRPAGGLVDAVGQVEDVVFVLFFTLAGTTLELDVIQEAGALAALIIVGRTLGKLVGVSIGGRITDTSDVVRRYLGIALLPKAGITVGLALLVLETPELAPIATLLVSGILSSTLVNELIAPPLAKFALTRAGETNRAAPTGDTDR
jgi:Kef-type K+ transport system membrane component KefB